MAIDTFVVLVGVYADAEDAEADLGEQLDEGQAGLIVVGVADMEARVNEAMKKAEKVEKKQLEADNEAIEADAKAAEADAKTGEA
jgi:hypothetical protein